MSTPPPGSQINTRGAADQESFAGFVRRASARGELVVQPRMGFGDPVQMRRGLVATRQAQATTVGTITLDSYTRVGDYAAIDRAMTNKVVLNGYPIVSYGPAVTRRMIDGVRNASFPIQVRHGSPDPERIFRTLMAAGLDATEGGPVSYCLPYSRLPLRASVDNWMRSCDLLAGLRDTGIEPHLESFGGCMLGQLCPPTLLVALSVLEGLFFQQHGLHSISLSYAQQTNIIQDTEAINTLQQLAAEFLSEIDWHVVLYTYMGVYPRTRKGALRLLSEAAELAVQTGAARLIVKTAAEAHHIPTITDNVEALETAAGAAAAASAKPRKTVQESGMLTETRTLIEAVLELHPNVGTALIRAFAKGYLDVPYCLHADNRGRSSSYVDAHGKLAWSSVGSMPILGVGEAGKTRRVTASDLLCSLSYVEQKFDGPVISSSLAKSPPRLLGST